jgi:pimeloyl-ACP methyl ester carboxylesterase
MTTGRLAIGAAVVATVGAIVLTIVLAPLLASALGLAPAPAPPPGEVVEIDGGVRLNVLIDGRGPPVVLVHGLGGSAYEWTDFVFWMTGSHATVVRYDRVGYGYSDRRAGDAPHDIASNARELIQLVETLELSTPMVIGWSYGGGVAMRAAEASPGLFGPIVLVSSVGPKHDAPSPHGSMPLAGREWLRKWAFSSGLARIFGARAGARAFSPASVPAEWLDRNISMMALPGAVATYMAERRDYDPGQMNPEGLHNPTIIIHGTGDRMVSIEVAEDLADRIRGSRLVRVELAGHMLPLTHPEAVAKRVRSFARGDNPRH